MLSEEALLLRSWHKTRRAPLLNREGSVIPTFGFSPLTTSVRKQENNGATCWIWVPPSPSSNTLVHKNYNFNNWVKFNYSLSSSLLPFHLPFVLDFNLAFVVDSIETWGRRRTAAGWWFCCCFVSSTNLQWRPFQSCPCSVSTRSPRCLVTTFLLLLPLLQFVYHLLLLTFLFNVDVVNVQVFVT